MATAFYAIPCHLDPGAQLLHCRLAAALPPPFPPGCCLLMMPRCHRGAKLAAAKSAAAATTAATLLPLLRYRHRPAPCRATFLCMSNMQLFNYKLSFTQMLQFFCAIVCVCKKLKLQLVCFLVLIYTHILRGWHWHFRERSGVH